MKKKLAGEDIDRISALPDSVICYILSFLPTKHAVATTILSTRWKNLFESVPVIDIDDDVLLNPQEFRSNERTYYDFINFVYKVLLSPNRSVLDEFRLRCVHLEEEASLLTVYTWISSVLWRKVQKIDIHLVPDINLYPLRIKLPSELFSCKSLVSLKLAARCDLDIRGSICLPNLETLYLGGLTLCNDDSINKLISASEVLEELILGKCKMNQLHLLKISSPSLTALSIGTIDNEDCKYSIVIDAPNLMMLDFDDCVAEGYQVKKINFLVLACICISFGKGYAEQSKLQNYYQVASKFIIEMCNVFNLELSGGSLEALHGSRSTLPLLPRVARMQLGVRRRCGWLMLPELLESSPNLKTLTFREGLLRAGSLKKDFKYRLPKQVPICLSEKLEEINIRDFEGVESEFKLLEYFVQNAQVLNKLSIWMRESRRSEESISLVCKKLSTILKSSQACQIVLYSDSYADESDKGITIHAA